MEGDWVVLLLCTRLTYSSISFSGPDRLCKEYYLPNLLVDKLPFETPFLQKSLLLHALNQKSE